MSAMSEVSPRWLLPLVAAVMVLAAAFVPEPEPEPVDGGRQTIDVQQTVWACPVQSGWSVTAGQVVGGDEATGRSIGSDATAADVWSDAGRWRTGRPAGDAFVLEQSGAGSGSVGFVSGDASRAQGGGAVLAACPAIADDAWFAGLGGPDRDAATVTLINLGTERAVADVSWWGESGPIESSDTTGLVVEAGQTKVVSVAEVAAGEGVVGLEVSRRRGALTAIATDGGAEGTELVDSVSGPARSQVLLGQPVDSGGRLSILNPGTTTAHVAVEVRGPKGSFAAEGLEDVAVEPESTRTVRIPNSVDIAGSALHVTSDVPVVAVASVSTADDFASLVAAEPISGPAAAPVRASGRPVRVLVGAGDAAATVTVETFTATMKSLGEQQISIEAGSTASVPAPEDQDADHVVLTPADGATVWAGLSTRDDDQIATTALRPAPVTVVAPGVSVR